MTSPAQSEVCDRSPGRSSDFSIDHILNRAGNTSNADTRAYQPFPWLQCTRYCPPKLPRSQKREGPHKRQLGRHPRIPFSSQQLTILEEKFRQSRYLSSAEVTQLSKVLQLADIRVKIWFQNRRARERRERSEKELQKIEVDTTNSPVVVEFQPLQESFVPSEMFSTYRKLDFRNISCFVDGN